MVTHTARSKRPAGTPARRYSGPPVLRPAGVCLLVCALLFLGCDVGNEEDTTLEQNFITGKWEGEYGDYYQLTAITLVFDGGPGSGWTFSGDIAGIVKFNETAGVIIFKYTTDSYDYSYPNDNLKGKFTAVYYKDYTATSAQMGTASDASYKTPTADTAAAAKAKFTADKASEYCTSPGTYTKQQP